MPNSDEAQEIIEDALKESHETHSVATNSIGFYVRLESASSQKEEEMYNRDACKTITER